MLVINILSLMALGLVIQIGGAYLVNAAVNLMGDHTLAGAASSGSAIAMEYEKYMNSIRSIEPRQYAHVIFVAPLVEEVVFRFLFLRAGKMVMPFWVANILQAVLFGIYHTIMLQKIYGFFMGLMIGCVCHYCPILYRRAVLEKKEILTNGSRSPVDVPDSLLGVAMTFILHMVINTTGLFVAPLLPANIAISSQIVIGILFMAAAVAACVMLYLSSRKGAIDIKEVWKR